MLAKSKHLNIRIAENDYNKIKQFADFNGKSISALMLDSVWERMEYQEDLEDILEYERQKADGTLETTSWEDIRKRLNL